jgi:hypothetical protein
VLSGRCPDGLHGCTSDVRSCTSGPPPTGLTTQRAPKSEAAADSSSVATITAFTYGWSVAPTGLAIQTITSASLSTNGIALAEALVASLRKRCAPKAHTKQTEFVAKTATKSHIEERIFLDKSRIFLLLFQAIYIYSRGRSDTEIRDNKIRPIAEICVASRPRVV